MFHLLFTCDITQSSVVLHGLSVLIYITEDHFIWCSGQHRCRLIGNGKGIFPPEKVDLQHQLSTITSGNFLHRSHKINCHLLPLSTSVKLLSSPGCLGSFMFGRLASFITGCYFFGLQPSCQARATSTAVTLSHEWVFQVICLSALLLLEMTTALVYQCLL